MRNAQKWAVTGVGNVVGEGIDGEVVGVGNLVLGSGNKGVGNRNFVVGNCGG